MILTMTYISNGNVISYYSENKEYLALLEKLTEIYKTSRLLANKDTKHLLLNGKKNDYFAYDFSYRNDYLILFLNFGTTTEPKFDLGMPYYGYYMIELDTLTGKSADEPLFTRNKKTQGKELAMQFNVEPYQAIVFKRLKDI